MVSLGKKCTPISMNRVFKHFKNNANKPFNIPTDVKNNPNQIVTEQVLYAQVVMLHQKDLKMSEENKNKANIKLNSRVSLQDHSVGFILILIVSKKSLAHVNLIYEKKSIKGMMKKNIQINLKCL